MQDQAHTNHVYVHGNKIVLKINATVVFPTEFVMTAVEEGFSFKCCIKVQNWHLLTICFQIK